MSTDFHKIGLSIDWQGETPFVELTIEAARLLGVTPGMRTITLRIEQAPIPVLTRSSPKLLKLVQALGAMSEEEREELMALSERVTAAFHPPGSEKAELIDPQSGARKCVTVTHPLRVRGKRPRDPSDD